MMGGLGWLGGFMCFLIIALVICVIVVIVRWLMQTSNSYSHGVTNNNSYIDIARDRYAKGEISKEEFDRIIRDLK